MGRALSLVLLALLSFGCRRHPKATALDAAVVVDASAPEPADPPATIRMVDPNELPMGNWEAVDGPKLCLTILPDGLVRFSSEVPTYRNAARIFGQVTVADSGDPDSFRIWVEVTKIYAKEIGPCHRHWMDFELFEANILDQRVTSPNADAQRIPQLGGGQAIEPPRGYSLHFNHDRTTLDLCTFANEPKCRRLTKKKSPSDISRVRTNGTCKVNEDCVLATDGEQCDPCLCPSKASLKSWPHKPDPTKEDLSWEVTQEHLCGKDVPRRDTCAACPELHAVCKNKVCVLKP